MPTVPRRPFLAALPPGGPPSAGHFLSSGSVMSPRGFQPRLPSPPPPFIVGIGPQFLNAFILK